MQELLKKLNKINVKIDLVDKKLDIQAPKGVMTEDLLNEIKLYKNDLIEFITVHKTKKEKLVIIPQTAIQPNYELSPFQLRLWIINKIRNSAEYNIVGEFISNDELDLLKLKFAISKVIERHEVLRTIFIEENGLPKQIILNHGELILDIEVLKKDSDIKKAIVAYSNYEFNLENWPLFKIFVVKDDLNFKLYFVIHHIICDAWSLEKFNLEIRTIYNDEINNVPFGLPKLDIQYKDFSNWLNKNIDDGTYDSQLNYWKTKLANHYPFLKLPYDNIISSSNENSKSYNLFLNIDYKNKIEKLVNENKVSFISFFLSCFKLLIWIC